MDPHLEYMEDMASPFPWSEDMGVFTDASASGGVLFGIGAGESHPALHSENYDFPDALLPLGIESVDKNGDGLCPQGEQTADRWKAALHTVVRPRKGRRRPGTPCDVPW